MDVVPPTTRQNPLCQCKLCEFSRSHYKFSLGIANTGNVLDLKKERGVYNLYVKVETGNAVDGSGGTVDVSPNEMEVDVQGAHAGASSSGNSRPAAWGRGQPRSPARP